MCVKMTLTKSVPERRRTPAPRRLTQGNTPALCINERKMLQTNETQHWMSSFFHLDSSKPAVPFLLASQIHKELNHKEVSIGLTIAWNIWREIGHALAFSVCNWRFVNNVYICGSFFHFIYRAVEEMSYCRITRGCFYLGNKSIWLVFF